MSVWRRCLLLGVWIVSAGWAVVMLPAALTGAEKSQAGRIASITEDEDGGRLLFPFFIFADSERNEIYILDSRGRIIVYTWDLFPFLTLDRRYGIESPLSIAIDGDGYLYIPQAPSNGDSRPRITVFDPGLRRYRNIFFDGIPQLATFAPQVVAVARNGDLYVAGPQVDGVAVLDKNGRFLRIMHAQEEEDPVPVTSVSIDDNGTIYLVSEEAGRIYVFNKDGTLRHSFGDKGGITGKLSRPQAAAANPLTGFLYVVDYMRHSVSTYDAKGRFQSEFGGMGWGEGWFQFPRHIAADRAGRLFIADTFNHRVEVYRP